MFSVESSENAVIWMSGVGQRIPIGQRPYDDQDIASHPQVWFAKGSDIVDWYQQHHRQEPT